MEKKWSPTLITSSETVLRANHLAMKTETPRLTPTGKISHAKTRVYTQRYRKEWEQMPDFKGWLTSVEHQQTRAYCKYCKKNLHAHRLSLLKHTCTMKHQRAALLHEAQQKKKAAVEALKKEVAGGMVPVEIDETAYHTQTDLDENEDEIEYVVERLETDDELEEGQIGQSTEDVTCEMDEEDIEDEEDDEISIQIPADDEEVKHAMKKIRIERVTNCRDPLAEAMDHMHGEYLDEDDTQGEVEMEMVVESEDHSNTEMQIVSILPSTEDDGKESAKESRENGRTIKREHRDEKRLSKMTEDGKSGDAGIVVACPLPILGGAYQVNSSAVPTSDTIGVMQSPNTTSTASARNKTITLSSGGKTVTLTGGTFQAGTQYVLSKLKGKLPTLVMADKKTAITTNQPDDGSLPIQKKEQMPVPSTSQQISKKNLLIKSLQSSIIKKPRISTHVVDTSKGLPVGGLQVSLYKLLDGRWTFLNESNTNANGRCVDLVDHMKVNFTAGRYKMHFDVDKYFTLRRIETMYPFIEIVFDVKNPAGHYHIPVLLSPFGYTTYRGSER